MKEWLRNKNNLKLLVRFGLIVIPVIIGILALSLPDALLMDPDFANDYPLACLQFFILVPFSPNWIGEYCISGIVAR